MIRLANTFMPHDPLKAHSVLGLFRSKNAADSLHRPIPAPEPNPEPNPAPDGRACAAYANITPDDWDQLFHAVTVRLEACASGTTAQAKVQTTVLECVSALNQLHAALLREREIRDH